MRTHKWNRTALHLVKTCPIPGCGFQTCDALALSRHLTHQHPHKRKGATFREFLAKAEEASKE